MTDMVNHPPHYMTDSGMEAIDVIKSFFQTNYNLGQVFKYIARCGKKNDSIEDLKKARWYLDTEIKWREEIADDENQGTLAVYSPYGDGTPRVGDRVKVVAPAWKGHYGEIVVIEHHGTKPMFPILVRLDSASVTYFEKSELMVKL